MSLSPKSDLKNLLIGAGFGLLLCVWLSITLLTFFYGTPLSFQRAGSLLIVFCIVTFAASRATERSLEDAVMKVTEQRIEQILREITSLETRSRARLFGDVEGATNDLYTDFRKNAEEWIETLPRARQMLRTIKASELIFLVIGTLQWGYGDLFHCWFNGKGLNGC